MRSFGVTDPGQFRANNEDDIHYDDERGIYLLIDGMGGHAAGEKATEIAKERMIVRLGRAVGTPDRRIREAITLANQAIFEAAREQPEWHGMACVLTAAIVEDGKTTVGHVGDSRLYKVTRDCLLRVTRDHSPVGDMERNGELTEEESLRHPRRNEVYRDVGSQSRDADEPDFIDIYEVDLEDDGGLLLCSDGLTDALLEREILAVVQEHAGDHAAAVRALVRAAIDAGTKDNVSVILAVGPAFGCPTPLVSPRSITFPKTGDARMQSAVPLPALPGEAAAALALDTGSEPVPNLSSRDKRWPFRMNPALTWRLASLLFGIAIGVGTTLAVYMGMQQKAGSPAVVGPAAVPRKLTVDANRTGGYRRIADAMADARAGDTIELVPADYMEAVHMKTGVTLRGGGAVVRMPPGMLPGAAITCENVRDAAVIDLKIGGGPSWQYGILVDGSELRIEKADISGASDSGILVRGNARVLIEKSHIYDNAGAGIVVRDDASAIIQFNRIVRNGKVGNLPAIQITSSKPSEMTDNYLDAAGAAIWQPTPASKALLEQNYFGAGHHNAKGRTVRVTGGGR